MLPKFMKIENNQCDYRVIGKKNQKATKRCGCHSINDKDKTGV